MKLELRYCDITAIELVNDKECYIDNKKLYINKQQLISRFGRPSLTDMDILLAHPGESCRIVNIGDVVQPRVKAESPNTTFPGMIGEMRRAGDGPTMVMRGVTVMEGLKIDLPQASIVDMSGPAAAYTEFSQTSNIIVSAAPAEDVGEYAYIDDLKSMVLSISRFLAELALPLDPDYREEFELKPKPSGCKLPKVIHVWVSFSHARNCEALFYGQDCQNILPTIVHPNEILDGAMINRNYHQLSNGETTYTMQNHALIRELYARDGVDIDFRGIVLLNASSNSDSKKRAALITATLAANFLDADLAVITKEGGGHPQLDMALCSDAMSEMGIKSALVIVELMATGSSDQESILFNTPNAGAIVSGGSFEQLELPAMERIIGSETMVGINANMHEAFTIPNRWIRGALSQIGGSYVTSITY